MSTPLDHIAYLSQEIGPRPAGTEEEQQAALYVTERFQKETRLPVNIEDFTCSSQADMPKLICYLVTLVSVLLALFVPFAAIPAVVASVLSAAVFLAESFDKPVLSQLFMKGVSQNVVAKYEPVRDEEGAGTRRRKVIVVANYDSGKVRHDLAGFMPAIQRSLQYAVIACMCALPFVILIHRFAFGGTGVGATAFMVIGLLMAAVVAVPAVFVALEKTAAYNEGANSNAAGVAVMLEVARRIASGEAASEGPSSGVMHDEETARAAGVVPEGAAISYEHASARAGADEAKDRVSDISSHLVQVKDEPLQTSASDDEVSKARKETRSALASAPIDTLAAAAAKAAELHEAAEAAQRAEEEARRRAEELAAAEAARLEEEERQRAAQQAAAHEEPPAPHVPDWYLKATEKARKSEPASHAGDSSYRSRYADFPDEGRMAETGEPVDEPFEEKEAPASEVQEIPGSAAPVPYEEDLPVSDAPQDGPAQADAAPAAAEESGRTASADDVASAAQPADSDDYLFGEQSSFFAAKRREKETAAADASEGEAPASASVPADAAREEAQESGANDGVSQAPADADSTTAIAPIAEGGNLDLDALRAAARQEAPAASQEHPAQVPFAPQGAANPAPDRHADGAAAETAAPSDAADADAEGTSRLPQMMYYTAPEDRTEELRDRARKARSVVTLTADEAEDMAVPVSEAQPIAPAAQVMSVPAETPALDQPTAALPVMGEQAPAVAVVHPAAGAEAPQNALSLPQIGTQPPAQEEKVIQANIPVVDLPRITLPAMKAPEPKPISFDELRQRAPLASVADSQGKAAAKDLLSVSLPSIAPAADGPVPTTGSAPAQVQNANVSKTGSFAPIGALGADPVGDELIQDVDPEDIYVDDADDSVFEEEFTESGAFAGPGYVDMPQSRVGRFFGKFRRKKKDEETSAHEWLDVDESFDARSAGKARGGWESFRDEDDTWQGGAFDGLKARLPRKGEPAADEAEEAHREPATNRLDAPSVSHDAFAAALAAANAAAEAKGEKPITEDDPYDDVQQIYSFAAGDINTEVWFVALGSQLAGNGGIKAFLAEHASDMRGAIIVNLESLGAGTLSYLEKEGELKQVGCSPRMKRFVRKASQASGVDVASATLDWRESAASYAQKHRMQAMTLAGMDGGKPAYYGQADDIIENIDAESLDRSADLVIELLKNI